MAELLEKLQRAANEELKKEFKNKGVKLSPGNFDILDFVKRRAEKLKEKADNLPPKEKDEVYKYDRDILFNLTEAELDEDDAFHKELEKEMKEKEMKQKRK